LSQRRGAALLFLALAAIAAVLRFPQLANRPMHADEAVNADKLGTLLEHGSFEYSTADFHGPTLYYLALATVRAAGFKRYADLNEVALRAVPALIGVLLVAAHFWLVPHLGLPAAACAALFTAVSPAMVYYSRYFIHETLLVFLTFCAMLALLAYFRSPSAARALAVGALFGLMYATKETWIIAAVCMAVAAVGRASARLLSLALSRASRNDPCRARCQRNSGRAESPPAGTIAPTELANCAPGEAKAQGRLSARHVWFAALTALLGAAALVAAWFPARRAARVDPAITLRGE